MIEEFKVFIPARALFLLAGEPAAPLDSKVMESMNEKGWLENCPAQLSLCSGNCPTVSNGNHRLNYWAQLNKLEQEIPVLLKIRTPAP